MRNVILALILLSCNIYSQNLKLKNGELYTNAKIITEDSLRLVTTNGLNTITISKNQIAEIIRIPFDSTRPMLERVPYLQPLETITARMNGESGTFVKKYPYQGLIPSALLGTALTYYFFNQKALLSDNIAAIEKSNAEIKKMKDPYNTMVTDTKSLSSQRDLHEILGIVTALATVANWILVFIPEYVKVAPTNNGLSINYNF